MKKTKIKIKYNKIDFSFLVLLYLAAQSFLNPFGLITDFLSKSLFVVIFIIAMIFALNKRKTVIEYPRKAYSFIILGILLSVLSAFFIHEQSLDVSFMATLPYLFGYLYFYILIKLKVPTVMVEKFFKVLSIISIIMYVSNLATYPNVAFGNAMEEVDTSRGFVRLGVPMIEVIVTFFLLNINQWLLTRKRKHLVWITILALMILLTLTRQVIAVSAVLAFLFILHNSSIYKKILVILVCILCVYVILPQVPMVKAMMELSEQQVQENADDEDIRVKAWRFYTVEFQDNIFCQIFGNGMPSYGNSRWGNYVDKTTGSPKDGGNGCYAVDVGWAGFFWYFGSISTISLIIMFRCAICRKKTPERQYLTYVFYFYMITSIASGPIIYNSLVSTLMLLFYVTFNDQKIKLSNKKIDYDFNNNSKLQKQ